MASTFKFRISYDSLDSEWDDFLKSIAGGHHVQSSLWGMVNSSLGWQTVRLVAHHGNRILGGAQVLFKPLSDSSAVGYVPRGPVFGGDDPELREALLKELCLLAKNHRITFLSLQPPNTATPWLDQLIELGFNHSRTDMGPTATALIDLAVDESTMLDRMKSRTRYNVRLSRRKGVRIVNGTARDLDAYCQLVKDTSTRQQFSRMPDGFFVKMWEVLEPHGHIKLFFSEYKGEFLSAQLIVAFGRTVVNKLSVWSGKHADLKTNEALQWHAILWSKAHGYHYYDLEGIDSQAADAILNDRDLRSEFKQSYTAFKLGFGGQVIRLPGVYDYIYSPSMRLFYDKALAEFDDVSMNRAHNFQF